MRCSPQCLRDIMLQICRERILSGNDTFGNDAGDLAFTRTDPYGTHVEPMYSGALSFMRRRYSREEFHEAARQTVANIEAFREKQGKKP